jgi:excinuclease ABC subunit C
MRHFASIEDIRAASVEELAALPELPRPAAEAIYGFFHAEGGN